MNLSIKMELYFMWYYNKISIHEKWEKTRWNKIWYLYIEAKLSSIDTLCLAYMAYSPRRLPQECEFPSSATYEIVFKDPGRSSAFSKSTVVLLRNFSLW